MQDNTTRPKGNYVISYGRSGGLYDLYNKEGVLMYKSIDYDELIKLHQ